MTATDNNAPAIQMQFLELLHDGVSDTFREDTHGHVKEAKRLHAQVGHMLDGALKMDMVQDLRYSVTRAYHLAERELRLLKALKDVVNEPIPEDGC